MNNEYIDLIFLILIIHSYIHFHVCCVYCIFVDSDYYIDHLKTTARSLDYAAGLYPLSIYLYHVQPPFVIGLIFSAACCSDLLTPCPRCGCGALISGPRHALCSRQLAIAVVTSGQLVSMSSVKCWAGSSVPCQ